MTNGSLKDIVGITFDFWGTLVDTQGSYDEGRASLLASVLGIESVKVADAMRRLLPTLQQVEIAGLALPTHTVLSLTLDELATALAPPAFREIAERWEQSMLEACPALLDGVYTTLLDLHERRFAIGLVCDTGLTPGWVLRRYMEAAGILQFFAHCTFSNEIGVTKRRRPGFLMTCRALGTLPAETLHVGDTPETDVIGAKRAGLKAAILLQHSNRRDGIPFADVALEHLDMLPSLLA